MTDSTPLVVNKRLKNFRFDFNSSKLKSFVLGKPFLVGGWQGAKRKANNKGLLFVARVASKLDLLAGQRVRGTNGGNPWGESRNKV